MAATSDTLDSSQQAVEVILKSLAGETLLSFESHVGQTVGMLRCTIQDACPGKNLNKLILGDQALEDWETPLDACTGHDHAVLYATFTELVTARFTHRARNEDWQDELWNVDLHPSTRQEFENASGDIGDGIVKWSISGLPDIFEKMLWTPFEFHDRPSGMVYTCRYKEALDSCPQDAERLGVLLRGAEVVGYIRFQTDESDGFELWADGHRLALKHTWST
eukprot:TRINITY_DN44160_c0_g1_i1.p1 TRINITY_DN44160_c0_g1~~TRINITY_DN44160_c0_g1_i1.p1  ORF type:complete len:221 (-),score=29.94 TRINITY_DN44160_c0_g1_i1:283-945(-)